MKNLGYGAQAFTKTRQPMRHDHELLKINRRIRMRAAIDHVRHRHRQYFRIWPAQILEQRKPRILRGRLGIGQRHGQNRICAQLRFEFGPIQLEHHAINGQLIQRIHPLEYWQDFLRHIRHRFRLSGLPPGR